MSLSDDLGIRALDSALNPPPPEPAIDPFALLGYTPTPKQALFHAATEYDVLYGGAAGGGKTRALVADDIRDAMRYPGIRIGAFRRTYDELAESLLKELAEFDFAEALGAKWNGTTRELVFPNKSRIRYRYAESVVDATRRQGGEYQKITIDERTLMAPEVVEILSERLRTSRVSVPVIGLRSGTNPGGPGHGPTKTKFIDATDHGAKIAVDDHGRRIRFIPARVDDNPHIDPGYKAQLDAIPDPARRRAMRDGDWDVFAGQVFEQWRRDRHVVPPMPMPLTWPRHVGIDYGYAAPWVVLWAAVDNDSRVWVYRELTAKKVIEREQARMILELEATDRTEGVRHADPSMWARTGEAPSPAMTYAAQGVGLVPAINDRVPGVQAVHSLLAEAPACAHHREAGWDTCPRLHVSEACDYLIKSLPALPRDPKRPEDVDTKADDHCLIAGTVVETARGQVPIEDVVAGDQVWTRVGLRDVLVSGMTGTSQPVFEVALSNGERLVGTGGHPVWTQTRGWIRLDALRYSDILLGWPTRRGTDASPSPSAASCSTATPAAPARQTRSTSARFLATLNAAWRHFTARSGKPRTGRSRPVTTFTTGTAILATTTWPTLSWSTAPDISASTATRRRAARSPRHTWTPSGRSLLNGTAATRAASGTASTAPVPGTDASRWSAPATTAGAGTALGTAKARPGSVRTLARPAHGSSQAPTTSMRPANAARPPSAATATQPSDSAPVRVLSVTPLAAPADVYNLTVAEQPEFFANGVLVHNCYDALRYLVMGVGSASAPVDLDAHRTKRQALSREDSWGAPDVDALNANF